MWLKLLINLNTSPNDIRAFARGYNGKAYERYEYHIKLAKALKEISND